MFGHYTGIISFWSSLLREPGEKTFLVPYVIETAQFLFVLIKKINVGYPRLGFEYFLNGFT
jgi:hypothetical protein